MKLRQAQGDIPAMLAAARPFLNGERARMDTLLATAKGFLEAGDRSSATALAKEVLCRAPDYPPARRMLTQMEPPQGGPP